MVSEKTLLQYGLERFVQLMLVEQVTKIDFSINPNGVRNFQKEKIFKRVTWKASYNQRLQKELIEKSTKVVDLGFLGTLLRNRIPLGY